MASVTNPVFQQLVLNAQTASAALFDAAFLRLTKSPVAITPATVLADLTAAEADYTGYAAQAVTWGLSFALADNVVRSLGDFHDFSPSGTATTNTVVNAYLTDTGQTTLMGAGTLAVPRPLADTTQAAGVLPCLPWRTPGVQGGVGVDMVFPWAIQLAILNELVSSSGLLHLAKAHLCQTNLSVLPSTTLAAFVAAEATYDGYAPQSIASWLGAIRDPVGQTRVSGAELRWAPTGSVTPNTIYSVFVTNTASNALYFAYSLPTPVNLAGTATGFYDAPMLTFGS